MEGVEEEEDGGGWIVVGRFATKFNYRMFPRYTFIRTHVFVFCIRLL